MWVRRPGCDRGRGRSSHSHINVDIFSLLSIIIAILFVFDWQIIALCAETYFHFIFLFLPSICCMRSIVWNKCTAPVVSPPSTILHHHSWHFGIKSNVRSVLSLSHSKSNQCNVDIGGRRYLSGFQNKKILLSNRTLSYPDSRNSGLQSISYQRQWVFGNFCFAGALIFPRFTHFHTNIWSFSSSLFAPMSNVSKRSLSGEQGWLWV